MSDSLYSQALGYHRFPRPGKISIAATKPLSEKRHLALAYSPGVAAACDAIANNPLDAAEYTSRSHLVAVITNGTAVLGLGNIGPLAAKPVMEGKAVLFKKFADLDVFDIEIKENDPDKLIEIIASLEPTFGGINLEDIKAPECFYIEKELQKRMGIPVFHDDQHGTAIVVAAAVLNALRLVKKNLEDVKLVTSGAGAAAIACLELLLQLGLRRENVILTDLEGVIYKGRPSLTDPVKIRYAAETEARHLKDIVPGADIFLGLSAGNVLTADMIREMTPNPIILALANPTPEIAPEIAKSVRPDAIIATGRSDYPNQINNVLCFPFIFRGALDAGAKEINHAMKLACVHALAALVHSTAPACVHRTYPGEALVFGPEYLIPKPFDPRLLTHLAPPVAQAAIDSGIATRALDTGSHVYLQQLHYVAFPSPLQHLSLPPLQGSIPVALIEEDTHNFLELGKELSRYTPFTWQFLNAHSTHDDPSIPTPELLRNFMTMAAKAHSNNPHIGVLISSDPALTFTKLKEAGDIFSSSPPQESAMVILGGMAAEPFLCVTPLITSSAAEVPLYALEKAVKILNALDHRPLIVHHDLIKPSDLATSEALASVELLSLQEPCVRQGNIFVSSHPQEGLTAARFLTKSSSFTPVATFCFLGNVIFILLSKGVTAAEIFDITSLAVTI